MNINLLIDNKDVAATAKATPALLATLAAT